MLFKEVKCKWSIERWSVKSLITKKLVCCHVCQGNRNPCKYILCQFLTCPAHCISQTRRRTCNKVLFCCHTPYGLHVQALNCWITHLSPPFFHITAASHTLQQDLPLLTISAKEILIRELLLIPHGFSTHTLNEY